MTQQPSTDQRLSNLEIEVASLRKQVAERLATLEQRQNRADDVDTALLIRIDSFIADLHRVERDQKRGFDDLKTGQKNLEADVAVLVETARDHKMAIELVASQVNKLAGNVNELTGNVGELARGQQQIIEMLMGGQPRRND